MSFSPSSDLPLVSVGMPVCNGAQHLRIALDALRTQDYPNLELIVSDNASQDETQAICQTYAAQEPRLRYTRNPDNIGLVRNFNRVFELARGEFFMWAACDDLWAPSFIRKCAQQLIANPTASLCHVQSQQMSNEGKPFGSPYTQYVNTDPCVHVRWKRVLADLDWHLAIYGMMRVTCMRQTHLLRNVWMSDQLFVAEMALYGTIAQVPECLWWHRRPEYISPGDAYRLVMKKLDPGRHVVRRRWTQLGIHKECIRIAMGAHLPMLTRWQLVADVVANYLSSGSGVNDLEELGLPLGVVRRAKGFLERLAHTVSKSPETVQGKQDR